MKLSQHGWSGSRQREPLMLCPFIALGVWSFNDCFGFGKNNTLFATFGDPIFDNLNWFMTLWDSFEIHLAKPLHDDMIVLTMVIRNFREVIELLTGVNYV